MYEVCVLNIQPHFRFFGPAKCKFNGNERTHVVVLNLRILLRFELLLFSGQLILRGEFQNLDVSWKLINILNQGQMLSILQAIIILSLKSPKLCILKILSHFILWWPLHSMLFTGKTAFRGSTIKENLTFYTKSRWITFSVVGAWSSSPVFCEAPERCILLHNTGPYNIKLCECSWVSGVRECLYVTLSKMYGL